MTINTSALSFSDVLAPPLSTRWASIAAGFARLRAATRARRQERQDRAILREMDEHMLRDIGVAPGEAYGRYGYRG